MPKETLKNIFFAIIVVGIFFCILNIAASFIARNQHVALKPMDPKLAKDLPGLFEPHQKRIILFPGLKDYEVSINALGFRHTNPKDQSPQSLKDLEGKYRILCMGDSETFGNHVSDKETYPYQLQSLFTQNDKNTIVLNAAVGGSTTVDYLDYIKRKGLDLKPDLVILNFFDNDLAELSREKPYYVELIEEQEFDLAEHIKSLPLLRAFRKLELNMRYQRWLHKTQDQRVKNTRKNDSQNIDDILYLVAHEGKEIVTDPYHKDLQPLWEEYFKQLNEFVNILRENDIDFIYIIYPNIYTVLHEDKPRYQDILIDHFHQNNIKYLDLRPILAKDKNNIGKYYTQIPRDFHLSTYTKGIIAKKIYHMITSPDKKLTAVQKWSNRDSQIMQPFSYRIETQNYWEEVWKQHSSEPAPEIDFSQNMAIALFSGQRVNAISIKDTSITETSEFIRFQYDVVGVQTIMTSFLSSPFGIFVLPKNDKPIYLEKNVQHLISGPPKWKEQGVLKNGNNVIEGPKRKILTQEEHKKYEQKELELFHQIENLQE